MLDPTTFTDTDREDNPCPETHVFEDVPGAPVRIGQTVIVTKAGDECCDAACIGHIGTVKYLHYGGGTGQLFPSDPLIGVHFPALEGKNESFFAEELYPLQEGMVHVFAVFPRDASGTYWFSSRDYAEARADFDRLRESRHEDIAFWVHTYEDEADCENEEQFVENGLFSSEDIKQAAEAAFL